MRALQFLVVAAIRARSDCSQNPQFGDYSLSCPGFERADQYNRYVGNAQELADGTADMLAGEVTSWSASGLGYCIRNAAAYNGAGSTDDGALYCTHNGNDNPTCHCGKAVTTGTLGIHNCWVLPPGASSSAHVTVSFSQPKTVRGFCVSRDKLNVGGDRYAGTNYLKVSNSSKGAASEIWRTIAQFTRIGAFSHCFQFKDDVLDVRQVRLSTDGYPAGDTFAPAIDSFEAFSTAAPSTPSCDANNFASLSRSCPGVRYEPATAYITKISGADAALATEVTNVLLGRPTYWSSSLAVSCNIDGVTASGAGSTIDGNTYAGNHCGKGINDGAYGNSNSWIPEAFPATVVIELDGSTRISGFCLSRDRTGALSDRRKQLNSVQVAETSSHSGPWKTLHRFQLSEGAGAHCFEFRQTVMARLVRLYVECSACAWTDYPAFDAFEVFSDAPKRWYYLKQLQSGNGVPVGESVGEMDVGELKKIDSKDIQLITGSSDELNTTLWLLNLNTSATTTVIELAIEEARLPGAGGGSRNDEVEVPAALSKPYSDSGLKLFVASSDSGSSHIMSRIVSINVRIGPNLTQLAVAQLTSPVRIKLHPRQGELVTDMTTCVWRNASTIGTAHPWREEGCSRSALVDTTAVVCECHHLTEFALSEGQRPDSRAEDAGSSVPFSDAGGNSAVVLVGTIMGVALLVVVVVLAGAKNRGWLGTAADTVLGESVRENMEAMGLAVYREMFGTVAQMKLMAPSNMQHGETKQVILLTEPIAEEEEKVAQGLGQMDLDSSGAAIKHGTRVATTIRVAEEEAFELRAGEEETHTFIWQGHSHKSEWYIKCLAQAKPGTTYPGAVFVTVRWGKDSRRLSHDIRILDDDAAVVPMMTVVNPMRLPSFGARSNSTQSSYSDGNVDKTGCLNDDAWENDKGEWEIQVGDKLGAAFAIDIANFKQLNDTTSHEEGDRVLKHTGADLREICAKKLPSAAVYHSGGDEFQIIATCDEDEGKFRTRVEQVTKEMAEKVEFEKKGVLCYLRIGVVCKMGATFKEADAVEHEVKAAIKAKRGKEADSREQVNGPKPEERYKIISPETAKIDLNYILAHTSEITGIPNRRQYEKDMVELKGKADALRCVFSLDMANLKILNEEKLGGVGHEAADKVLTFFARELQEEVNGAAPQTAPVVLHNSYHMHGDEFCAVVASAIPEASAFQVAMEKLAQRIASIGFSSSDEKCAPFAVEGKKYPETYFRVGALCSPGADYDSADKLQEFVGVQMKADYPDRSKVVPLAGRINYKFTTSGLSAEERAKLEDATAPVRPSAASAAERSVL
eukprot:g1072.t1